MNLKNVFLIVFFFTLSIANVVSFSICAYQDNSMIVHASDEDQYEVKFNGIAVEFHEASEIGAASYWIVDVDEVINGSQSLSDRVDVITYQSIVPPWGYADPDIEEGDFVEVYGLYLQWRLNTGRDTITLNGSEDYYIEKSSINLGPPFWMEWWFLATIGAVAVVLVVVFFRVIKKKPEPMIIAPPE